MSGTQVDQGGRRGALAAIAAQGIWGAGVLFWPLLADLPASTILAHRVIWSCSFLFVVLLFNGHWPQVRLALQDKRSLSALVLCSLLLASNWLLYLWAVNSGRIVQASLGYFICPIFNVLMGRVLLGERMSRAQSLAVMICFVGVAAGIAVYGRLPWVSLVLAVTFAVYGFFQKTVRVEAAPALFVQTLLLLPLALIWLGFAHPTDWGGMIGYGPGRVLALIATLCFTAIPLLMFSYGAKRIDLSTLGIIQYINPSLSFLIAILIKHEQINPGDLITFPLIWLALLIYSIDTARRLRSLPGISAAGKACKIKTEL